MPDEKEKVDLAPSWRQIIRDVIALLTVIFSTYGAYLATHTNTKVEKVEVRTGKIEETQQKVQDTQEVAAQSTKEVKTALDERAKKVDKDTEEQRKATEIQLLGNWKYLENIAEQTGTILDRANADKAKQTYDEFKKKKP